MHERGGSAERLDRRHFVAIAIAFVAQAFWGASAAWMLGLFCGVTTLLAVVAFPTSGPSVDYRIAFEGWAYGFLLMNLVGVLSVSLAVAVDFRVPVTLPLAGAGYATIGTYMFLALIAQ